MRFGDILERIDGELPVTTAPPRPREWHRAAEVTVRRPSEAARTLTMTPVEFERELLPYSQLLDRKIGYLELAYVLKYHSTDAMLKNLAGRFVLPSQATVAAAAAAFAVIPISAEADGIPGVVMTDSQ